MRSPDEPTNLTAICGPPAVVVLTAVVLHLLPHAVLNILTAWILVSFPIGVLIGHCALSEE